MEKLIKSTNPIKNVDEYNASKIEILEGLEPVRKRPGMYVGGTDQNALHHLFSEILDNCIDEVIGGFADKIEVSLENETTISIQDNGRGIPIDPHPKFPKKSALEVIFTTLHSGGKFSNQVYKTSGGLHGVGASVVNALSSFLEVEISKNKNLYKQTFSRGKKLSDLIKVGKVLNRKGTKIKFVPDKDIFGDHNKFNPSVIYNILKSKAYLFSGIQIKWSCNPSLLINETNINEKEIFCFENGINDYINELTKNKNLFLSDRFSESIVINKEKFEWSIVWLNSEEDTFLNSFCNAVPTKLGGTHETGFKNAITKGIRFYGELTGYKKASELTSEDVLSSSIGIFSIFISDPQFQGQTKEKLVSTDAAKKIENAIKDRFELWLSSNPERSRDLLQKAITEMEERKRKKKEKELSKKLVKNKVRLPGKLCDCSFNNNEINEIFIVEGDSAGGSAKSARERNFQAVLPLRGKILNVASATQSKISQNQELYDLSLALGVKPGKEFNINDLRYNKIIIMTDADVDGAHISALLMTFFYNEMPQLIENGHLFLAQPPLFRISNGNETFYALDEKKCDEIVKTEFSSKSKVEISRFKGLGEMPPKQLKETTMNVNTRRLQKVIIPKRDFLGADKRRNIDKLITILMGKKPELRFNYIKEHSKKVESKLDI